MESVCQNQLFLESIFSKEVVADFQGGRITSDAGGLLLRELDKRYGVIEKIADSLRDPRDSHKVKHGLVTLVRQRLFAIAQGYEYANDAGALAKDHAFKIMADRAPETAADLASKPTRSPFENRVTAKDWRRLSEWLLKLYFKIHPRPRKVIFLDLDATCDPTPGLPQFSFFHVFITNHRVLALAPLFWKRPSGNTRKPEKSSASSLFSAIRRSPGTVPGASSPRWIMAPWAPTPCRGHHLESPP